jgi:hypothetical protein
MRTRPSGGSACGLHDKNKSRIPCYLSVHPRQRGRPWGGRSRTLFALRHRLGQALDLRAPERAAHAHDRRRAGRERVRHRAPHVLHVRARALARPRHARERPRALVLPARHCHLTHQPVLARRGGRAPCSACAAYCAAPAACCCCCCCWCCWWWPPNIWSKKPLNCADASAASQDTLRIASSIRDILQEEEVNVEGGCRSSLHSRALISHTPSFPSAMPTSAATRNLSAEDASESSTS